MSKHVLRSLTTHGALIAGPRYRGPNMGMLDRMDAPTLTDQDLERKTPDSDISSV